MIRTRPLASILLTSNRCQRRIQNRRQQAAAIGLGSGEQSFELVAKGQEGVNFGDDAELLGEGWAWRIHLDFFV